MVNRDRPIRKSHAIVRAFRAGRRKAASIGAMIIAYFALVEQHHTTMTNLFQGKPRNATYYWLTDDSSQRIGMRNAATAPTLQRVFVLPWLTFRHPLSRIHIREGEFSRNHGGSLFGP